MTGYLRSARFNNFQVETTNSNACIDPTEESERSLSVYAQVFLRSWEDSCCVDYGSWNTHVLTRGRFLFFYDQNSSFFFGVSFLFCSICAAIGRHGFLFKIIVTICVFTIYYVLTFCAVITLPSSQTYYLSSWWTAVMSELIVARTTQIFTTLSIIVRVAGDAIFKTQCWIFRCVDIFRPFFANVQQTLFRQSTYQYWKKRN